MPYKIEIDATESLVICRVEGFLDETATTRMAAEWRDAIASARERFGQLRVLFDNSEGTVATANSAKLLIGATTHLWRAGDRTAVVVTSNLSKMQATRTMRAGNKVFTSEMAARIWLAT